MDQLQRDVLELLHFSLDGPAGVAPLFFPMFRRSEIEALYEIPLAARRRIWASRDRPRYRALFAGADPAIGSTPPIHRPAGARDPIQP